MSPCLQGIYWYGGTFRTDALDSLPFIVDEGWNKGLDAAGNNRGKIYPNQYGTLCDRSKISIRKVRPDGPCFEEELENKAIHGERHGATPPYLTVHPMSVGMTFEGWQESTGVVRTYDQRINGGCLRVLTYKCCKWDRETQTMTLPEPTIWAWRTGGPEDESVFRPHTSCSWTVRHQRNQFQGGVSGTYRGWQWKDATYTPNKPTGADIVQILKEAFDDPKRWNNCIAPAFDMCLIAFIYAVYNRTNKGQPNLQCVQTRIGDGRVYLQGCIDSLWGQACS